MSHKNTPASQTKTLGRRELLKALAATGGAVTAATLLPGQWSKPVIEAGVLPAHAQSSAIVLSNLTAPVVPDNSASPQAFRIYASVAYTDGVGGIDDNAELSWTSESTPSSTEAGAQATQTYTEKLANLDWGPDGFSGTITFSVFGDDPVQFCSDATVTVNYLKSSDGRMSNSISTEFTVNCD